MGHLLPLKLASITDKSVDQMAVCSWPRYITHLDLAYRSWAEPAAQGRSGVHRAVLSCESLCTPCCHLSSPPHARGLMLPGDGGQRSPQRQYLLLWTAWDHYLARVPWPKPASSSPVDIHWHALAIATTAVHYGCVNFYGWTVWVCALARGCLQETALWGDGHAVVSIFTDVHSLRSKRGAGVKRAFCKSDWVTCMTVFNQSVFLSGDQLFHLQTLCSPSSSSAAGAGWRESHAGRTEQGWTPQHWGNCKKKKTTRNTHDNRHIWTRCLSGARVDRYRHLKAAGSIWRHPAD